MHRSQRPGPVTSAELGSLAGTAQLTQSGLANILRCAIPGYPHETSGLSKEVTSFLYPGVPLPDLLPARAWIPGGSGMSGVSANATIVATYQALDEQFELYLGKPAPSTWLTFAKYAAREVGSWIRSAEALLSAVGALDLARLAPAARLRSARTFARAMHSDGLLNVAGSAMHKALRDTVSTPMSLSDATALLRLALKIYKVAQAARAGLVEGNTELYRRLAFAFDLFMRAEAAGHDGQLALHEVIQSGALDDSFRCIRAAFSKYSDARQLGLHARSPAISPVARLMLDACRRRLIYDANLLIAVQEQGLILQRASIFGHSLIRGMLGAPEPGAIFLTLPGRGKAQRFYRFALLPGGGNWADFEVRMGFKEVSAGTESAGEVYAVRFPDGPQDVRYFVPDLSRSGTVLDLFTAYFDGPAAAALRRGKPREILPRFPGAF